MSISIDEIKAHYSNYPNSKIIHIAQTQADTDETYAKGASMSNFADYDYGDADLRTLEDSANLPEEKDRVYGAEFFVDY